VKRRHHVSPEVLQRGVKQAIKLANISKNVAVATPSVIALPPICSRTVTTLELFKNCSVIRTCGQQLSIHMSLIAAAEALGVLSTANTISS
jgi:hypothetical protein